MTWPKRKDNSSYALHFAVKSIEILKRRNKRKEPCFDDFNNYDDHVLENGMRTIGCRPPYQKSIYNLPICGTKEDMQKVNNYLRLEVGKNYPPCVEITDMQYSYSEFEGSELGMETNGIFAIQVTWPDQFKIVKQSRDISIQTLIGNGGGYVGLFLGKRVCLNYYRICV